MENKQLWLILVIALFGGNLTGLTGILGNEQSAQGGRELQTRIDSIQRQLVDIKQNDKECRESLSKLADKCADTQNTVERHEAQIREIRRYLGIN